MSVEFILTALGAYLLGSVPAAYLAAKWSRGIDIRKYGSGNVGASNLLEFTSKRAGIPVIIFDIAKGAAAVWAARLIGLDTVQQVVVGTAAIVGHNWPVFLRFNGGRGILTILGVVSILAPWLGLVMVIIAFGFAPFHQLAVGVLLAMLSAPILAWSVSQPLAIADKLPITLGLLAMFLIVVIRRLTAPPSTFAASVPRGQLFINRLLLDRDIRDRKTWINQSLPAASPQPDRKVE